jgi:hypothetical protein
MLFDFQIGVQRWTVRVWSSAALLCDRFPPYSFAADAPSPGRLTAGLSGLVGLGAAASVSLVLVAVIAYLWVTRDWDDVSLQYCAPFRQAAPAEVYAGYAFGKIRVDTADPAPVGAPYLVEVSQSNGPQDLDSSDFQLTTTSGSRLNPFAAFIGGDDSTPVTTLFFQLEQGTSPEQLQYDPGLFSKSQTISLAGQCT